MRLAVLALVLTSATVNILALTGPLFMLQVYDRVLSSRSIPTLVALAFLVVVLFAFYAALDASRARILARLVTFIDDDWSARVFGAANRMWLSRRGEDADAIRDLDTVRQVSAGAAPIALLDLPWMPFYFALVFLMHPLLGWLAVGGASLVLGIVVASEFALREPSRRVLGANWSRQKLAENARANVELSHAIGMLPNLEREWGLANAESNRSQFALNVRAATFSASSRALRMMLQSAVLGLGALLVIEGEISSGVMIGASMIAARGLAPIDMLVGQWRALIAARAAFKRLRTMLRDFPRHQQDMQLPPPRYSVDVVNLATAPRKGERPVVAGVAFSLKAGDGLGILGASGSGKSSLLRALLGLWPTTIGEVRLDGALLGQYQPDHLGRVVGYLPQTVELFEGSIAQNIARFEAGASSDTIIAAARAANVHELIVGLENGYDTEVGNLGSQLSAGQRQRVGLARALFGDPFLIVLDEPNSNLDAPGDEALTHALHQARRRGAIVIVVAHRPSAIAAVDQVLYLSGGRQIAFGPKSEVMPTITRPPRGPRRAVPSVAND